MHKKPAAPIFIVVTLLLSSALLLCSACGKKRYNSNLSDLGGVYAAAFNQIDFSVEISGSLIEGENTEQDSKMTTTDIYASNEYSSKVICWGLKRNQNHRAPDADPGAPELLEKYNGLYIGDVNTKRLYLTFDEGYENGYTEKILDVLRDNEVKAAFFITGPYLSTQQALVRRMVEEGHVVGNHTIHHPSLPSLSDKELEEEVVGLDRAFNEKFGKNMKFLRPPKGEYSERTLAITDKLGYVNVFWSFAYDDWYRDKCRGADYAYDKVMSNLHNGAVILLHAVSKDNADALGRIIDGGRAEGYSFGSLEELVKR
jgi:peptidoglycan-N-acetylmuramic acid deacetylase